MDYFTIYIIFGYNFCKVALDDETILQAHKNQLKTYGTHSIILPFIAYIFCVLIWPVFFIKTWWE